MLCMVCMDFVTESYKLTKMKHKCWIEESQEVNPEGTIINSVRDTADV